jgi:hypothetical protein
MDDDQKTDETAETPVEATDEAPKGEDTPKPDSEPEAKPEDELPEWARKELTKARNEAAGYRTRLREAEDKLKDAKTPEEFETALTEFRTKNAELERNLVVTKVAAKYELPAELAARLQGEDEAAIEADAKALAALVVTPQVNPENLRGGLNPTDDDDEFDPVKAAHAAKKRRY